MYGVQSLANNILRTYHSDYVLYQASELGAIQGPGRRKAIVWYSAVSVKISRHPLLLRPLSLVGDGALETKSEETEATLR